MKHPPPPEDNGPDRGEPTEAIDEPMKTIKTSTPTGHGKPFIPAWLDEASLSPAEMRVFVHLCRSADNATGVAWPSYDRMRTICQLGKATVWRCIKTLEERRMIEKIGKPFGGSCRYRILPMVSPQERLDTSNSFTTGTNEGAPIVSPQNRNRSSNETPIVSPQEQEGSPSKVLQGRFSTTGKKTKTAYEPSLEAMQFACWFKSSLPDSFNLAPNWQKSFAKVYEELVRIDGRKPEDIKRICQWARTDSFWRSNFMSPAKLRKRTDGVQLFDSLAEKMKGTTTPTNEHKSKPTELQLGGRTKTINTIQ